MGCQLLLVFFCLNTAPEAYFEASDSIWKGFVLSMSYRTGTVVNLVFSVLQFLRYEEESFQCMQVHIALARCYGIVPQGCSER
jgi:hypothetical protein